MLQFQSFWVFIFWISNGGGNFPSFLTSEGVRRFKGSWGTGGPRSPSTGSHFCQVLWIQGNFYDWVHITANCFCFNLNVLKFKLQYEWTSPQIFFCGYRILQLLCHILKGAHDINWNFTDFRDLHCVKYRNFT